MSTPSLSVTASVVVTLLWPPTTVATFTVLPAFIPGAIILSPTSIPVLSAIFTVVELLTAPLTVVLAAVGLGMSKLTEQIV